MVRAQQARNDPQLQALILAACAANTTLWVNDWVWTYDPREKPATLPFNLFPRQEEFIAWLQERETNEEDGIAEKCRDVGFTWLCAAYAAHGFLFRRGWRVGFGSRKLELVDRVGDPKCIFEKVRFILDNLPDWMLPGGGKGYSAGYCKILNFDNGSSISGEGGDGIGRGDRTSIYFLDEAAFIERPERVEAALSQTSRVKIKVSTPNGMGNVFYQQRHSGTFPVFTFRWQDDPRKTLAWYERQKQILDPVILAQEVDLDYAASIEGVCIPAKWVQAAVEFAAWLKRERGLEFPGADGQGELRAALDIAEEGSNQSVLTLRRKAFIERIEHWGQMLTTATAHKARGIVEESGAVLLNYDAGGGYGASVKGMMESAAAPLGFRAVGLNGGEPASENRYWPDGRTSREKFINKRAELAWMLRTRFEKTFEFKEEGVGHPLDELISIPNHNRLIADLSLPLVETTDTGKIRLEGKDKMRRRGVKSPDFFDSLIYSEEEADFVINVW